jgi:hypothetical protein
MAQHDEKATDTGSEYTGSTVEGAMSAINTASKNMQAIASEMLEISKQSFETYDANLGKTPARARRGRGRRNPDGLRERSIRACSAACPEIRRTHDGGSRPDHQDLSRCMA